MSLAADELALLDAIHADPRNDVPRLAYADWLADRESPIAELIRWQVATRRGVSAVVGRKVLRDARIRDRRKFEQGMETSDAPFDTDRLNRVMLTQLNEWIRPFPPEARGARPGVTFYRGVPCIEWEHNDFRSLSGLDKIGRRLLPHVRPRGGIIDLESAGISQILAHPVMGRIDHLGIRMDESPTLLLDFVARFAESHLPDRIEWLSLLGNSATPLIDKEVWGMADERLGNRMVVMTAEQKSVHPLETE